MQSTEVPNPNRSVGESAKWRGKLRTTRRCMWCGCALAPCPLTLMSCVCAVRRSRRAGRRPRAAPDGDGGGERRTVRSDPDDDTDRGSVSCRPTHRPHSATGTRDTAHATDRNAACNAVVLWTALVTLQSVPCANTLTGSDHLRPSPSRLEAPLILLYPKPAIAVAPRCCSHDAVHMARRAGAGAIQPSLPRRPGTCPPDRTSELVLQKHTRPIPGGGGSLLRAARSARRAFPCTLLTRCPSRRRAC